MNFRNIVAAHNVAYRGRDGSLAQRLLWWAEHLGDHDVASITADHIHRAFALRP